MSFLRPITKINALDEGFVKLVLDKKVQKKSNFSFKYAVLGFCMGVYATTGGYVLYRSQPYIHKVLASNHLLPEPETLTELYFENHLKLPAYLNNTKPYTFSFTIHNLEYKTMTYHYQVTAEASDSATVWDDGTVTIPHDVKQTITESVADKLPAQRTKVVINLVDQNQPIHFWMDVWKPSPTQTPSTK